MVFSDEQSKSRNEVSWRQLGKFLALAVLVIFLVNLVALINVGRIDRLAFATTIGLKWDLMNRMEDPVDWLILGDSSAASNVEPAAFVEGTDETAVNLATVGHALLLGNVWMLEAYMEKHGPPKKGVIVMQVYDVWHRDLNHDVLTQFPLQTHFWLDFPGTSLSTTERLKSVLHRLAPLYSRDATIPVLAMRPWEIIGHPKSVISGSGYNRRKVGDPITTMRSYDDEHGPFVRTNDFEVSEENIWAANRLIELAERDSLQVFIAPSPLYDVFARDPDFIEYNTELLEYLEDVQSNSEFVNTVMTETYTVSGDALQGIEHMIDTAAIEYTKELRANIDELR